MKQNGAISTYLLLQINDALFPIGGYSHSYGLETYIQKGIVRDADSAASYIRQKLLCSLASSELLTVRLAWERADRADLDGLEELEELLEASRTPREVREAAQKLGSRFVKTLLRLEIPYESQIFQEYVSRRQTAGVSHACAYGVFCRAVGLPLAEVLSHFLYAQTSAMVTNCVKSVPLSQTVGQRILTESCGLFRTILEAVEDYGEEMLYASAPGFDIRCMEHENLYSRIYMS